MSASPRTHRSPLTSAALAGAASVFILAVGCSSTSDTVDVGLARPDAGLARPDATQADATQADAAEADAGVGDADPTDAGEPTCSTNPMTHLEIINACTDAEFVEKRVSLPLLNPDGTLPPLP